MVWKHPDSKIGDLLLEKVREMIQTSVEKLFGKNLVQMKKIFQSKSFHRRNQNVARQKFKKKQINSRIWPKIFKKNKATSLSFLFETSNTKAKEFSIEMAFLLQSWKSWNPVVFA